MANYDAETDGLQVGDIFFTVPVQPCILICFETKDHATFEHLAKKKIL